MKRKITVAIFSYFFALPLIAQKPVRCDAQMVVKLIATLPSTVEEVHSVFTIYTKYGPEFSMDTLRHPYSIVESLDKAIHDSLIRETMRKNARTDMVDSIYYEDIRWKLATLRPLLGADVKSKLLKTDVRSRDKVLEVFELQKIFDWQDYYETDAKLMVKYSGIEGSITHSDEEQEVKARKILAVQHEHFTTRQKLWKEKYDVYVKAFLHVHQLLEDLQYGEDVSETDKKIILPVLADVQARSLETIEKMIWKEYPLLIMGETDYFGKRVLGIDINDTTEISNK